MMNLTESKLKTAMKTKPLCRSQKMRGREIILKENSHSLYVTENGVHKSSCIEVYYQVGQQGTRLNMVLELLAQLINEPAFNTLRTKEQLGYIVFSGLRRMYGVQGLRVIIQSERHPNYLDSRIETFLESMVDHIENMSEKDFEQNKTALAERRLEKPKKLTDRTSKFWSEIASQQFNFNRDEIETEELKSIGKEDVLDLLKTKVLAKSGQRKKLSCHVVSMAEEGAGKLDQDLEPPTDVNTKVACPAEFKFRHAFHPVLEPFADPESMKKKTE